MTYFPKEIFTLICDYTNKSIYQQKFDIVVKQINIFKNDWITDYWKWWYDEGWHQWELNGNYDFNLTMAELIDMVCKNKEVCQKYNDYLSIYEEDRDENGNLIVVNKKLYLEVYRNISVISAKYTPMNPETHI